MAYKLSAAGMELRTPTHGAMKNKEDTTMKKFITDIKTLAALLMAGAAFTACSSDDNIIEQPQNPTEPQVYTMVIKASKGGDTTTRALKPGTDSETGKNTVDAYWSGDETIEVYQSGEKIGEATAAPSANGNTTITAELTSAPNPSSDLDFYLGGKTPDYTGQVGLLTGTNSISENYDYATDLVYSGAYTVDEINKKITPNEGSLPLTFGAAQQAIIKFTLKDKANDAAISPSALTVTDGTSTVELTSIPAATYTANGGDNNVLYVAFPAAGSAKTIPLTATVGDNTYIYEKTGVSFTNGQYYEIGVKMIVYPTVLSAVTADYHGSVICSDGTVYPPKTAVPDGKTVVGILGKVTEKGHGLILALNDAIMYPDWNDINNWTSVKTYAGTTLKVLPDDARGTNLTSYTALGETAVSNWAVAQKSDYVAIFTNLGSTTGSGTGKTYDSNVNAYITTGVGGTALSPSGVPFYWSATQEDGTYAWYFNDSYWSLANKEGNFKIRPVLGFGEEAEEQAAPTLAETMTTAGMTVKVNYNYADEENYCLFVSNDDGTYTFQSGDGYVGGDANCAKALVVEGGKLVFKQNVFGTIDSSWDDCGFSVTFDTSNNTYSEWFGEQIKDIYNPSFTSVEVNGTQIAVTAAQ